MTNVKATNTCTLKKIVHAQGTDFETAFLHELNEKARITYDCAITSAWITDEREKEIMDVAVAFFFRNHPDPYYELGCLLAQHTLTGIYKVFLRIPTIPYVIRRGSLLWSSFMKKGRVDFKHVKKHSACVVISDIPEFRLYQHELLRGYMHVILEIMGKTDIQIQLDDSNPAAWTWSLQWK
jgi:hypothetical protein